MNAPVKSHHHPLWVRIVATLVVAAMLAMALGCYGNFPLTKAVYHFNGDVTDNELAQSILFWVFVILPVYGLANLGDVLIFNLIEFWSGETLDVSQADGDRAITVTLGESATPIESVEVAPGLFEVRDAIGTVLGTVHRTDAGDLELCDTEGAVVRTITSTQIADMRLAHAL